MPTSSQTQEASASLKAELDAAVQAIDDMAAYIAKLEAALLSTPLTNPAQAVTAQERKQVARQNEWMHRHKDVLSRARGVPDRSAEVLKQKAIGQVKLRSSQIRIMNERHRLGDKSATFVDAELALHLLMEDLSKLC